MLEQARYMAAHLRRIEPLLYETHFYFIAWHNCREMLNALTSAPELVEARRAFYKSIAVFDSYSSGRHCFEHFNERLPGNKHEAKVVAVGENRVKKYLSFHDGVFEHSDESWDITPKSLELLQGFIAEVLNLVHKQVDELLAQKFPNP